MTESSPERTETELEWRSFLVDQPPGARGWLDRAAYEEDFNVGVKIPELQLYCDGGCQSTSHCKGRKTASGKLLGGLEANEFRPDGSSLPRLRNMPQDVLIAYACETCGRVVKSYAIRFFNVAKSVDRYERVEVAKLAEWPEFSPRTPSRVIGLLGPDRELFLKGRRSEVGGLGVGAFSYYRRVVEQQKNRLLDEIIRVAVRSEAPPRTIEVLEAAKRETQFQKAVESVKDAIPRALYLKGHNPLTLLYRALSDGLHDQPDEVCLQAANDVRLILVALAEKLAEALRDQKELDSALERLINGKKQSPE